MHLRGYRHVQVPPEAQEIDRQYMSAIRRHCMLDSDPQHAPNNSLMPVQWFMQIKCILYAHYLHTTGALCTLGRSVQIVVVTNPTQTFAGSKGTICLSGLATMPTDPESFDLQIVGAW